jgi:hypothetical protein
MDKVYAHDDQIGPFARMAFIQGTTFTTSWQNAGHTCELRAAATAVMVPLYHKVRIPFDTILGIVSSFASLMESSRQGGAVPLAAPLEWDIYLTTVNVLKTELQQSTTLGGEYRRRVLSLPMPRFLWRATGWLGEDPAFEILFDATDIEQGPSFVGLISYDNALLPAVAGVAQGLTQQPQIGSRPDRHILTWLVDPTF